MKLFALGLSSLVLTVTGSLSGQDRQCQASPQDVYAGSASRIICPCSVSNWKAERGSISGSGSTGILDTTGAASGPLVVSATCGSSSHILTTVIVVKSEPPLTISCVANPSNVAAGELIHLSVAGVDFNPQHKLVYQWMTEHGKLVGDLNQSTIALDTSGLGSGNYSASVTVTDPERAIGGTAYCGISFQVHASEMRPRD